MSPFPWRRRSPEPVAPEREPTPLEVVRAYHEVTKHAPTRYARGPGELDWANQPEPFKRWEGAPLVELERFPPAADVEDALCYTEVYAPERRAPARLERASLARLLHDSFALSAWKEYQGSRWALRVNPSSGNLHPTEVHVVCGPLTGVSELPFVAHYAPREHALELRAELFADAWSRLARGLPEGSLLVALSSIPWREAWKYGERAWRYCQHDCGHGLAALSLSAASLGWHARLVDTWGSADLELLLGLPPDSGPETEVPEALVLITPVRAPLDAPAPPAAELEAELERTSWRGTPGELSPEHVEWELIDLVAKAARKPRTPPGAHAPAPRPSADPAPAGPPWREVVHHRRSAVAMDGSTSMAAEDLVSVLRRTLPGAPPFDLFPFAAAVDLALFVHRVEGLESGVYALVRDPAREADLRAAMHADLEWQRPELAGDLPLWRLRSADVRGLAASASCGQAIAGDGCFSLGMLADLEALEAHGPHQYARLFWECGAIGQVLYLEAEALGLRGTGIGCFFDDQVHRTLGLQTRRFQSLYHFAFGGPVEDKRLSTLPAYT